MKSIPRVIDTPRFWLRPSTNSWIGWAGAPLYYVSAPPLVKEMLNDTDHFVKGAKRPGVNVEAVERGVVVAVVVRHLADLALDALTYPIRATRFAAGGLEPPAA